MTGDAQLALPQGSQAPASARAWLCEHATGLGEDTIGDALLVVSELVTNAVCHGRADAVLRLERFDSRIRISVSDASDAMPEPSRGVHLDAPSGRGLMIVAATAADWGVRRNDPGPGKTVWADLEL